MSRRKAEARREPTRFRSIVERVSRPTLRAAAGLLLAIIVIGSIWMPVLAHYSVDSPQITASTVEAARRSPADALWRIVQGDRLMSHGWTRPADVVSAAEDLLGGKLRIAGQRPVQVHVPFSPADLQLSPSSLELPMAGLVHVDLLLRAYELSGDARFFESATASILEFSRYERRARLPRGFLWNDHAVANRIFVLSDFWRLYRERDGFRPEIAAAVLMAAARGGAFLADPRHFTVASNHGVMQNLALLRFALSFPTLPDAPRFRQLAFDRLREQMLFYVADDGVVLEHSAFYQFFGLSLLERAFRYLDLLGIAVPGEWQVKYQRALAFAAQLRRPDGTLPVFGDTVWGSRRVATTAGPARERTTWFPIGGYVVWWDGDDHQTILASSNFAGHAHKHADDLSVLLWAAGHSWWTDLGYWSYQSPQRAQAASWDGSNAPHLDGESATSARTTGLRAVGSSVATDVVDAVREGPGAYRARRQVVYLRPDTWLVLDVVSEMPERASVSRWSTGYGTTIRGDAASGRYDLRSADGRVRLRTFFLGSAGVTSQIRPKSLGPFDPQRRLDAAHVPAVEVTQPPGSWAAAVWVIDRAGTLTIMPSSQPKMLLWGGPDRWEVSLPAGRMRQTIARNGDRIVVSHDGSVDDKVILAAVDRSGFAAVRKAFVQSAARYPTFRDRIRWRFLSTYGLLAVWTTQEIALFALSRRAKRVSDSARLITVALWILGGIVLAALLRSS